MFGFIHVRVSRTTHLWLKLIALHGSSEFQLQVLESILEAKKFYLRTPKHVK